MYQLLVPFRPNNYNHGDVEHAPKTQKTHSHGYVEQQLPVSDGKGVFQTNHAHLLPKTKKLLGTSALLVVTRKLVVKCFPTSAFRDERSLRTPERGLFRYKSQAEVPRVGLDLSFVPVPGAKHLGGPPNMQEVNLLG